MFLSARLFAVRWIKTLDLEINDWSAKVLKKGMTNRCVLVWFGFGVGCQGLGWGEGGVVCLFLLIRASTVSSPERKQSQLNGIYIDHCIYMCELLYKPLFYRM